MTLDRLKRGAGADSLHSPVIASWFFVRTLFYLSYLNTNPRPMTRPLVGHAPWPKFVHAQKKGGNHVREIANKFATAADARYRRVKA
jgi:hypothetical protein